VRSSMINSPIAPPDPSRQIAFHQLLVAARKTWLIDALSEALSRLDPADVKAQVVAYVPPRAQQVLAKAAVRDEHVFPIPLVLEAAPTLVGYYRLLLGVPQKTFYGRGTGMGLFKSMEMKGTLNQRQKIRLPDFCRAMSTALDKLVRQLSPSVTRRDIGELPLLTLGSFFQGANNVRIGKQATVGVFLAMAEIVEKFITERTEQKLTLSNAAGRRVNLALGADPDVKIEEDFSGKFRRKVAIEIKGGTDASNAHNRAGEAEKSHQKAKSQGFRDFWTLIATRGLDLKRLKAGSPTTTSWFDVAQVLGRTGEDWEEFRSHLADAVGIPLPN
jgi:hypothetical protein